MTEPKTEDKLTAGTLRKMIQEEVTSIADKLFPGKSSTDAPKGTDEKSNPGNVKQQVIEALAHLRDKEARDEKDQRIDKMLADYEKPPEEKAPKERRFIEKVMGWHDPADDK